MAESPAQWYSITDMNLPHGVDWDIATKRAERVVLPKGGKLFTPRVVVHKRGIKFLSARERSIVAHLAAGLTPKEISTVIGLTLGTIKQYIVLAKRRAGAKTSYQLVALYVEDRHSVRINTDCRPEQPTSHEESD